MCAVALFALVGSASSAFAENVVATDNQNNCKLYTASQYPAIIKVLGKCNDGWYSGQIVYGAGRATSYSIVEAGTMISGDFKGVNLKISYFGDKLDSVSVFEGKNASKTFVRENKLENVLDEITRLTNIDGDNKDPANRNLLENVTRAYFKDQNGFYNEFIRASGSTGIAINAPIAAEPPDDPQIRGASASPKGVKSKGKKKK